MVELIPFSEFFVENLQALSRRQGHLAWSGDDLVELPSRLKEDQQLSLNLDPPKPVYKKSKAKHLDKDPTPKQEAHFAKEKAQVLSHPSHYKHVDVMEQYKMDSQEHFNDHLRDASRHNKKGNIEVDPDVMHRVKHLDHLTDRPIAHDIHVYRAWGQGPAAEKHRDAPVGHRFQDHGYTGTSFHRSVAQGFSGGYKWDTKAHATDDIHHIAHIHVPAGSHGYYLDAHENNPNSTEKEFLLHRGTKFEVIGHSHFTEPHQMASLYPEGHPGSKRKNQFFVQHLRVVGNEAKPLEEEKYSKRGTDW